MVIKLRKIEKNVTNTIIINKSKFITSLFIVKSEDEVNQILSEIKTTYKDATHNCYAYILDNGAKQKMSDDGEPAKTAGSPILGVLQKNDLTNILAVVTRYFGGIKLGSGGLTRAYANSVSEALLLTNIIDQEKVEFYEIKINYPTYARIADFLKEYKIVKESFSNEVSIVVGVKLRELKYFKMELENLTLGKLIMTYLYSEE